MPILLRLKHWQMFLLTAGTYAGVVMAPLFILQLVSMGKWALYIGPTLTFVSYLARSLWQLTLVRELHKKLPEEHTVKIGLFLFIFFIQFSYSIAVSLFSIARGLVDLPEQIIAAYLMYSMPSLFYWLITFAIAIYFSYMISKLLNTVERQERRLSVSDMILLIFFPIGIWWVQPRVNKIFSDEPIFEPNTPLDQNIN